MPSFYGTAAGRRNDEVVTQFSSARLVNSVFARARTQHLPAAQLVGRPICHPGEARSPYHAADRVVAGSSANDSRTPRVAPRAQIQTSLTPPQYAPPSALAARALGMDDGCVQGLLVRNWLQNDERRRRKIRRQREVMAEQARLLREARTQQEHLEREKRRRPSPLGPGKHPQRAARLRSVLKRRSHDNDMYYCGPSPSAQILTPTSTATSTSTKKKTHAKVTFRPDETLAQDEEGEWVPHRDTDIAEYEERWSPAPSVALYDSHKRRRHERAVALMEERRRRRVERNRGYERDYWIQQERIRCEIMVGHEGEGEGEDEDESEREEEGAHGEDCGEEEEAEEVVLLGIQGVDSEGAR